MNRVRDPAARLLRDSFLDLSLISIRGITFVGEDDREERVDYATFAASIARAGCNLFEKLGNRVDRPIAVISPDCRVQTAVFWACAVTGRHSSVLPPPSLLVPASHYRQSVPAMLAALSPRALVTDQTTLPRLQKLLGETLDSLSCPVICWEELAQDATPRETGDNQASSSWVDRLLDTSADPPPGSLAYIQFSSGTAGKPKGVCLTHGNIAANLSAMAQRLQATPEDVGISWLPLYHDMGLMGGHLIPAWAGMEQTLMRPLGFLSRPHRWLQRISRSRCSLAVGPCFAYELCAEKVDPARLPADLDLSCLRAALNGSETIRATGLKIFQDAFASTGLAPEAILPCYGLAEATLAVTIGEPGTRPELGVRPGVTDSAPVVGVGKPVPGVSVRILDSSRKEVSEGAEGEIAASGPSVMKGYLETTSGDPFLVDPSGTRWLLTGDLGYLQEGSLFVTGRIKDLIVVRGRNHDPADLEAATESVPGVRPGKSVAYSWVSPNTGLEEVHVLFEVLAEAPPEIETAVKQRVGEVLGIQVDRVAIVPRGFVSRTTSGKKMRQRAREEFLKIEERDK